MKGARCHVFTEKDGLLSKIAHDLRIRVDRFDIDVQHEGDDRSVTATFDTSSLVVETALSRGVDNPTGLSAADRDKIEQTIRKDVLDSRKHPKIRFRSTRIESSSVGWKVEGDLELHGRTRPIRFDVSDEGDVWGASVTLHQPDFGIKPYRAALGALKIKPDVRIELRVPKP